MSKTFSDKYQKVFENMKTIMCSSPVMAAPQVEEQFSLQVDTSMWEQVLFCYREIILRGD